MKATLYFSISLQGGENKEQVSSCTVLQFRFLVLGRAATAVEGCGQHTPSPCHVGEAGTETFQSPVNNASQRQQSLFKLKVN